MIEAKNVSKTYNKGTHRANTVLENASLVLPDKGLVCIIGKSGIGKSTILNAIGGLISYEGDILYDGKKVNIETYRRKNIGYVFQDFLLFDELSIRDNIKIVLNLNGIYDEEEISNRVALLLKAVDLDVNAARRASALSLGQRQRVAIARALASNPHLILADEPTGNLDSKNSLYVMDTLKRLSLNRLVIVVTHNANLVNLYADKAFAIIDKNFREVNPKDQQVTEAYESHQAIQIGKMSEKDYEDENFVIRLYSGSNKGGKTELKIIQQNGKTLIVGDNLVLASPKDVEFAKAEEASKAEDHVGGEINLNFPPHEDKKRFKDSALYSNLVLRFSAKRNGFGRSLLHLIEVIIPLVVFILLDTLSGINVNLRAYGQSVVVADNLTALYNSPDADAKKTALSEEGIAKLLADPDSGLIDSPSYTAASGLTSYASVHPSHEFTASIGVNAYDCDFVSEALNYSTASDGNTFVLALADATNYQKTVKGGELRNYTLSEGEVVLDKSILADLALSYRFPNKKSLYDILPGTKIRLPLPSYEDGYTSTVNRYKEFTVKGVVDTGFKLGYGCAEDVRWFRYAFGASPLLTETRALSNVRSVPFPDFSDYRLVNYQDVIASSDYSIVKADVSLDDYDPKSAPLCYLSEESKKTIITDAAGSYYLTSGARYPQSRAASGDSYAYTYSQLFGVDPNYTITYLPNPSQKVICFRTLNNIDSSNTFLKNLLVSKFAHQLQFEAPSSLKFLSGNAPKDKGDLAIPSSLASLSNDVSSLFPATSPIRVCGVYEASDYESPVYANEKTWNTLCLINNLTTSIDGTNATGLAITLSRQNLYFVTVDAAKTANYLKAHAELGLTCKSYSDIYYDIFTTTLFTQMKSLIIAIAVLILLMAAIEMMDSFSRINKLKYRYGVLRSLGMPRGEILWNDATGVLLDSFFYVAVPSAIVAILLSIFALYYLGVGYFFLFLLGYFAISFLASELPLLLILAHKPNEIVRSLQ
jgi:ABC-type lipoprotein export system ATPase subunit